MNLKKVAIATALTLSAAGLSVTAQAADKKYCLKPLLPLVATFQLWARLSNGLLIEFRKPLVARSK